MEPTKHKVLSTEVVHDAKWLKLMKSRYEYDKYGERAEGEWLWASRNGESTPKCDAVVLAAIHIDGQGIQRLVITDEFRVPIGCREYGFPAGLVDPGKTPEDTCVKELWEETNLKLTRILEVPTPLALSSAGMTNEAVRIFYGYCEGEPSRENLHPGEDINTHLLGWNEIDDLLRSGAPIGGKALGIITQMWMQGHVGFSMPGKPQIQVNVQSNRATVTDNQGRELFLLQSPAPFEVEVKNPVMVEAKIKKPATPVQQQE